jgi:hypothetical protein
MKTEEPGFLNGLSYEKAVCKDFQDIRDLYTKEFKNLDIPLTVLPC